MSVASAISDLLYVRENVVIPGLGAFVCKNVAAKANVITNHFEPPFRQIEFDARLREENDVLANYISERDDVTYDEAKNEILKFVSDCFTTLRNGQKVELQKIGRLSYDPSMEIWFEQDDASNFNTDAFGLTDFYPEPVYRVDTHAKIKTEIEQQQKDKNTPMAVAKPDRYEAPVAIEVMESEKPEPVPIAEKPHETQNGNETLPEAENSPKRRYGWLWIILILAGIVVALAWLYRSQSLNFSLRKSQIPVEEKVIPSSKQQSDAVSSDAAVSDTISAIMEAVVDSLAKNDSLLESYPKDEHILQNSDSETISSVPAQTSTDKKYAIIGGCFSVKENADELVDGLHAKGYPNAYVAGQNKGGLWMVSYGSYATYQEASDELQKIKATNNSAWISKL